MWLALRAQAEANHVAVEMSNRSKKQTAKHCQTTALLPALDEQIAQFFYTAA
jgi:hypothetical protein